jgi:CheY-like chemotaxis protein
VDQEDGLLLHGFCGLLIPRQVSHALRVCLVDQARARVEAAMNELGLSEKEAYRLIQEHDEDCQAWVREHTAKEDPWDPDLYDVVLPMGKTGVDEAVATIREFAAKGVVQPDEASRAAARDFLLAARVEVALAKEGHDVVVEARDGRVALTINKHVLMLARLEEELKEIASSVEGVQGVETRVGKDFHQTDIYRKYNFETPSKVLLVDDEREFVQTLSERLTMRDMGSAVAYDGESALELIREDEPEVMILDLKMPGIDGIEVLRRVKQERPEIEVIILTGHGSSEDRKTCMELGAFDYLHKPVDIDTLSEALRRANEKIRARQEEGE